ncbi:MAG: hypothetical protein AAGJ35_14150, partial [Myxococcota bacterium]
QAKRIAWLPSADNSLIERVGITLPQDDITHTTLYRQDRLRFLDVNTGSLRAGDARVVRFDPREGVDRAYILTRLPEAVLIAQTRQDTFPRGELDVLDVVGVCPGPSKLEVLPWLNRLVGFVSCFDGRALYILDLDQGQVLGITKGMSGPFEIAVDLEREWVFIADFGVSTIRVVSLDPLRQCLEAQGDTECSPRVIASIGIPQPVEEIN